MLSTFPTKRWIWSAIGLFLSFFVWQFFLGWLYTHNVFFHDPTQGGHIYGIGNSIWLLSAFVVTLVSQPTRQQVYAALCLTAVWGVLAILWGHLGKQVSTVGLSWWFPISYTSAPNDLYLNHANVWTAIHSTIFWLIVSVYIGTFALYQISKSVKAK